MTEVYSCGKTNLPSNVARRITSALLFSLNSSRAWNLCNFPFTVESGFCLKNVHCRYGHRFMHHVVGTHGNLTSVRDVVLVSLLCTLCGSMIMFSWAPFEHDDFSLFVSISVQSLSQGRSQLELFELAGVVTLPSIAEALLISRVLLSWFPQNQYHRPEWNKCHIFHLPRPIWVFLQPNCFWHCAVNPMTCLTIRLAKCSVVLLCSTPTYILLVDLGWANANRVTPIQGSDSDFSPYMFQSSSVAASWSTSMLVLFVSDHHDDSEESEDVLWSNMIPICVIIDITPEIFATFKIWLWIFGFFLLLTSVSWISCLTSPPAWYTAVENVSFLQDFAHSAWECNFIASFLNVHFFWFEFQYVNFRCGNVLRSSVSALNGSQVQHPPAFNAYSENYPRKTFADALDLGLVFCRQKSSILVLLQMKTIGPSKGSVWASRNLVGSGNEVVLISQTCSRSTSRCLTKGGSIHQHWRSAFFYSSYSSFRNTMSFGSVRSRSLMIPILLLASLNKFMRSVHKNGSWVSSGCKKCQRLLCVSWTELVVHG